MLKTLGINFAAAAVLFLTFSANSHAQICSTPGCLDQTFGAVGTTVTYVPATKPLNPAKSAVQSDGKILSLIMPLYGDIFSNALIRYNPDGSIDQSFGSSGIVTLYWASTSGMAHAYAIAVQKVGTEDRIVVAGTGTGYTSNLRVDRLLPDGNADASFGSGGTATFTAGAAEAIAIQPDGKIITAGTYGSVTRLNVNGTLDKTFNKAGYIQNNTWKINSIAVQADGRIVAVGYWTNVQGAAIMSAWRFNTNGSLDDGKGSDSTKGDLYGKGGQALIDGYNAAWDVKIDSSGKAVVGGSFGSGNTDFAAVRLTTAGLLDSTFGSGGKKTIDFDGFGDQVKSVQLTSEGKIVLIGFTNSASGADAGLVRLTATGSLDLTFGQGGKTVSDLSREGQANYNGLIQIDPLCGCEKLVTPGTVIIDGIYYAVAARYVL